MQSFKSVEQRASYWKSRFKIALTPLLVSRLIFCCSPTQTTTAESNKKFSKITKLYSTTLPQTLDLSPQTLDLSPSRANCTSSNILHPVFLLVDSIIPCEIFSVQVFTRMFYGQFFLGFHFPSFLLVYVALVYRRSFYFNCGCQLESYSLNEYCIVLYSSHMTQPRKPPPSDDAAQLLLTSFSLTSVFGSLSLQETEPSSAICFSFHNFATVKGPIYMQKCAQHYGVIIYSRTFVTTLHPLLFHILSNFPKTVVALYLMSARSPSRRDPPLLYRHINLDPVGFLPFLYFHNLCLVWVDCKPHFAASA